MTWPILIVLIPLLYLFLQFTSSSYTRLPNSYGHTSTIYKLSNNGTPLICKSIHPHCADTLFPIENEAYRRFSAHSTPSSLLTYHGIHPDIPAGIILEHAESGNLYHWLSTRRQLSRAPSEQILYKWAAQATEALQFAHALGVLHSDIHCLNFFLTKDLDLKVGDWGGASINGSKSHCSYRYSHRLFDVDGTDIPGEHGISVATEIFALGTAFYAMVSGEEPWPELVELDDREEIRRRIAKKMFPDTTRLRILGNVVNRCWHGGFASMEEVRHAVQGEWDEFRERDQTDITSPSVLIQ